MTTIKHVISSYLTNWTNAEIRVGHDDEKGEFFAIDSHGNEWARSEKMAIVHAEVVNKDFEIHNILKG